MRWKAEGSAAVEYPFSVIELRVDRRGIGEGTSLAAKVVADEAGHSLALENDAAAPALLKDVTRNDAGASSP